MKFLQTSEYDSLTKAATAWSDLVSGILKDNPDMKTEEITAEQILSAMNEGGDSAGLQQQLETAQEDIKSKDRTIEKLTSENAALKGTPAKSATGVKKDKEDSAGEPDIVAFAEKNDGDTLAIMEEAKKNGFF